MTPAFLTALLTLAQGASPGLAGSLAAHCGLKNGALGKAWGSGQEGSLPLLGDPNTIGPFGPRVVAALRAEFGVDASCLRVVALGAQELQYRFAALNNTRFPVAVAGFHRPDLALDETVFVAAESLEQDDEVVVHEVLHALSHRLILEGHAADAHNLIEGLTEHFTRIAMEHQFHRPRSAWTHHYPGFVAAADALSNLIGEAALRACFFHKGYKALVATADEQIPGSVPHAAEALEAGAIGDALRDLGEPIEPQAQSKLEAEQACELGNGMACRELGRAMRGERTARARLMWARACALGDDEGCAQIAATPRATIGHARAAEWLKIGCRRGSQTACRAAGRVARRDDQ